MASTIASWLNEDFRITFELEKKSEVVELLIILVQNSVIEFRRTEQVMQASAQVFADSGWAKPIRELNVRPWGSPLGSERMEVDQKMIAKGMVLAHRGEWQSSNEQNQIVALARAVKHGFGIETDLRDLLGRVVISHDPPGSSAADVGELLAILDSQSFQGVLALNVKADGLISLMSESTSILKRFDYFFFDMSYPEALKYASENLDLATRRSEFEACYLGRQPVGESQKNVWIDCFDSDWWIDQRWSDIAPNGERVFFVSPELHGRDPKNAWTKLREFALAGQIFGICTDRPADFWSFLKGAHG